MDRYDRLIKAAREYGSTRGHKGNQGGWIGDGRQTFAQGWHSYSLQFRREILDYYTRKLTGFDRFADLVNSNERYSPTIMPRNWQYVFLADAFDAAMEARKSPRRAWRGSQAAA